MSTRRKVRSMHSLAKAPMTEDEIPPVDSKIKQPGFKFDPEVTKVLEQFRSAKTIPITTTEIEDKQFSAHYSTGDKAGRCMCCVREDSERRIVISAVRRPGHSVMRDFRLVLCDTCATSMQLTVRSALTGTLVALQR